MTDKYIAFDLEIAEEIPEGCTDWPSTRPGISCAATIVGGEEPILWHGYDLGYPATLAPGMGHRECRILALYLVGKALSGCTVITWNGLGFDFRVLVQECASPVFAGMLKELASGPLHIDMMFAFFCDKGFAVGLDAVAKGMGLEGKPKGMDGALAPKLWRQGREEQQAVLEYVAQDVRTTAEIYQVASERHQVNWLTRSGKTGLWRLPYQGWPSVSGALALPSPDVSWMDDPWPRSKFYGWLSDAQESEEQSCCSTRKESQCE